MPTKSFNQKQSSSTIDIVIRLPFPTNMNFHIYSIQYRFNSYNLIEFSIEIIFHLLWIWPNFFFQFWKGFIAINVVILSFLQPTYILPAPYSRVLVKLWFIQSWNVGQPLYLSFCLIQLFSIKSYKLYHLLLFTCIWIRKKNILIIKK